MPALRQDAVATLDVVRGIVDEVRAGGLVAVGHDRGDGPVEIRRPGPPPLRACRMTHPRFAGFFDGTEGGVAGFRVLVAIMVVPRPLLRFGKRDP